MVSVSAKKVKKKFHACVPLKIKEVARQNSQGTICTCTVYNAEVGVLVRKLIQLPRSAKLSRLTPGISSGSVESAMS